MSQRIKTYMILTILLLNQWFAASALASHAMPDMPDCAMAHSSMDMSSHEQNGHNQNNTDTDQSTMDCCKQDCTCPVISCSSAALLNIAATSITFQPGFVFIHYQFSSLTAPLSGLQKPPQA